jgi:hypothetical protein
LKQEYTDSNRAHSDGNSVSVDTSVSNPKLHISSTSLQCLVSS